MPGNEIGGNVLDLFLVFSWGQRQMPLCLAFMWVWGSKCSFHYCVASTLLMGQHYWLFFRLLCLFVSFFVSFLKLIYFEAGFLLVSLTAVTCSVEPGWP